MSNDKQHPVCRYCGSDDISSDAVAYWNTDKNAWDISGVFDGGYCNACEQEMKFFNWIDIKPEKGRAIPKHHIEWWKVLKQAFADDNVALMTCGSKEGTRSVICMVNKEPDGFTFVPVGELCEADNPFTHYTPPFLENEDGS